MKKVTWIGVLTILATAMVFVFEVCEPKRNTGIKRNSYGEGEKVEQYELHIEEENYETLVEIDVQEQRYSEKEAQELFEELVQKLDKVVLGENESFDRVDKDLQLVTAVSGYPMEIVWELSSYRLLSPAGNIHEEYVSEEGDLVELKARIMYEGMETIYIRNAVIYPPKRNEEEQFLYEVEQEINRIQEETREEASFELPKEISGKKLTWKKISQRRWYCIPLIGGSAMAFLIYQERKKEKEREQRRQEALTDAYPGFISKLTLLMGTGATVKYAWEKIVQNYERQKEMTGENILYEELGMTLREMQSGITEAEAYERFGKRCGGTLYLKFGTLLAQNLRKGSRGLVELLRMEAIQSFEERKNRAKRLGEEASTKLLGPMFGMLAVVFVVVMVPAFLSMQI